ncbi:cobalamin biosynthesis protein [Chelatococcus sambhunathii]|uniref:Cobalamin biosynthesis protein CobD n=2 Tax=Chelatococcus sambhunathii TaxID=363953 RepID=A0ABU1DEC0_9HYPH|nr:cobalamin biosynthesis protein [Chelatococcus sambhunathii]
MLVALVIDAVVGDPDGIWRRLAHPVAVIGAAIGWFDRRFNRLELDESVRRRRGVVAIAAITLGAATVGWLLAFPFRDHGWGVLVEGAIGSILLAQNSLYVHVARVRDAFSAGGLGAARHAVSMIVGRDPTKLDESGVACGAIESAAENFSDGVVAPVFWGLLFGLPGLFAYKAINTADSMIGHRTERHRAFGWAAARLDDLVNLPASRLSGAIVAFAALVTGRDWRAGLAAMRRDAGSHASPNAGWPETAFAGALGIALGGPRVYSGVTRDLPYMNAAGRKTLTIGDIGEALRLLRAACVVHAGLVALIAAAFLVTA